MVSFPQVKAAACTCTFSCGGRRVLTVSYYWAVGSGVDLDTKTALTNPVEGPVGYSVGTSSAHMTWSGDTTQNAGTESVDIQLDSLIGTAVTGTMSAAWFYSVGTGQVNYAGILTKGSTTLGQFTGSATVSNLAGAGYVSIGTFTVDATGNTLSFA